jgi:hypothetical protein
VEAEHIEGRTAKMKRLVIVCEGPTEKEFCHDLLAPELSKRGIIVEAPLIKKSGGGVVSWATLRQQIIMHLNEGEAYVSTMIDYYGIKDSFMFPKWEAAKAIADKQKRMEYLEEAMRQDVPEKFHTYFIPYLQLHEFESLLFSDICVLNKEFDITSTSFERFQKSVSCFRNPEEVNNSPITAPSKRIQNLIPAYEKALDGNYLALEIGLAVMTMKCPHFRQWFRRLASL